MTLDTHQDTEQRYAQRLNRYVTAMRNELPDMVPIRPFVAEVTDVYAGYNCQEVTHDYDKALIAARKCAADFDWDAVVANMVYVWTGLAQALGLKYYGIPGIHIPPDVGFQYSEPEEEQAWMRPDEYIDAARLACALERHRIAQGRLPDTLQALTRDLLDRVPVDPATGDPLHYRRTDDGRFVLYSAGLDGQDNGGRIVIDSFGKLKADAPGTDRVWKYPG